MQVNNFTEIESIYGKFIINRHCHYQIDAVAKTGKTHIESELENIFRVVDTLPENSTIIDGGANIGFFTIPVAQRVKHKNIKIVAFEPQKLIYYALCGAIALNDLENCWAHNFALGNSLKKVVLPIVDYSKPDDYGQVHLINEVPGDENAFLFNQIVYSIPIDNLNLPNVGFIKLDVEGSELEALEGAQKTIKTFKPYLWIEYHIIGLDNIVSGVNQISPYDFYIQDPQNVLCVAKNVD